MTDSHWVDGQWRAALMRCPTLDARQVLENEMRRAHEANKKQTSRNRSYRKTVRAKVQSSQETKKPELAA
jgi:hypothetical protein